MNAVARHNVRPHINSQIVIAIASLKQMASSVKIFLPCLFLFLLTTFQTADAFVKPKEERTTSAHQGTVPKMKHDTNVVQTSSIRRPPSGPNPEGNFEVNAASQDVGKRGAKIQNVDAEKKLTRTITENVARKDVGKHELHTTGLRRPPSGPNPEGNFEVNAASQDVGKRGAKVQNVDEVSKDLTGSTQG